MKINKNAFLSFKQDLDKVLQLNHSNKLECFKIIEIGQSAAERIIAGSTTIP
jgi:hypothetical protein